MKKISVVVPVYNEEKGICHFLSKDLIPELNRLEDKYNFELILVNDGSSDNTLTILQSFINDNKKTLNSPIKLVAFARNFGKEIALSAGIKEATGDAVLTIDADGQQPPKEIHKFIESWENGNEIIVGVRDHFTKHGFIPRLGSKMFYKLFRIMGNKDTVPGSTEHNRITRGLIDWMGYKKEYINYVYGNRFAGKPSYTFKKLFKLAIDSFVSMSDTPLVIFGYLGSLISIFSALLGLFIIINQYVLGDPLRLYWNGAVQMTVFITFLIGLVMISQYVAALYISHIHSETQNRPLYIISKKNSKNLKK